MDAGGRPFRASVARARAAGAWLRHPPFPGLRRRRGRRSGRSVSFSRSTAARGGWSPGPRQFPGAGGPVYCGPGRSCAGTRPEAARRADGRERPPGAIAWPPEMTMAPRFDKRNESPELARSRRLRECAPRSGLVLTASRGESREGNTLSWVAGARPPPGVIGSETEQRFSRRSKSLRRQESNLHALV